ncbi:MAG: hypothetical protein ABI723_04745 [Bacteroidia bacterium]
MNKRFRLILLLLFSFSYSFSQSGSQSPYSRYGLGDIQYSGFTSQLAMGGFSIAQNDSLSLNFNNAASYAALRLTVFDMAVRGERSRYKIDDATGKRYNGGLSYIAIGFPIIYKKWGGSAGIIPYSTTGYNIQTTGTISDTVSYKNLFTGQGGLNRLYFGNGFHITRNLSLGFNTSYLFGTINKTRNTEFIEQGFYSSAYKVSSTYGTLNFDFGGLFKTDSLFYIHKKDFKRYTVRDSITAVGDTIKITDDNLPRELSSMEKKRLKASRWLRLNIGVTGTYSDHVTETDEILSYTYKKFASTQLPKDTLLYQPNLKNDVNLPSYIALGISLQDHYHWLIGADATFQQWSKYIQSDVQDSLKNSFKLSFGGELTPKFNSINFFQRVTYRAGFRYTQTQLNLRNTPINEFAFTFGFGIPIRKDNVTAAFGNYFSRMNVSFELGQRGTTDNHLLKEQYFRINLGLNITEQWFIKRKYD